jgi:predicted nucleic acid-binding protein
MARYLIDTNLLLRLSDTPSPQNPIAARALARLFQDGHELFITAQNLIEFWAVATRPVEVNGLGWDVWRTRSEVRDIREKFPLLPDSPGIFDEWLRLVEELPLVGKRVHDARLVAVMKANGIDRLVTFNTGDFSIFPGLAVIDPHILTEASEQT